MLNWPGPTATPRFLIAPSPMTELLPTPAFLQGGHQMGERIRAFDWASHPLGPPAQWPPALQMAMSLCLSSTFPTAVYWGPEAYLLYNDAWSVIPADRHPAALGQPAHEVWSDIWNIVGPHFDQVFRIGEGFSTYEEMLPMVRDGAARETWWNYSLTAIRNSDQTVGGVFNQGNEVTEAVLARRARKAEVERWRLLFRQAPAAVALLRGPTHVYEIANDAYLSMVGPRDLLGKTVKEALPEVAAQGYVSLLDQVYRSGEPYVGHGISLKLQRQPGQPPEERVVDFVYHPVRDTAGQVDGIFVLATDVTDRARAEEALRISNWQLGEERARLAALVDAEQRAQNALRRFNDTLEAHVRQRTAELSRALAAQSAVADRLRATFQTHLIYQGFMDTEGILLDANATSLAGIQRPLHEVVGKPFWDTPWFSDTPGLVESVRAAVAAAAKGQVVAQPMEVNLPIGRRSFDFSLRPVINARGEVIGIVPEAVDVTDRTRPER